MQRLILGFYLTVLSSSYLVCLFCNAEIERKFMGGTRFGLSDEEADEMNEIAINGQKQQPLPQPPAMFEGLRKYDWVSGMTLQELEDGDIGSDESDYEGDYEHSSVEDEPEQYSENGVPVRNQIQQDNVAPIPSQPWSDGESMDSDDEPDYMDIDGEEPATMQFNNVAQAGYKNAFLERAGSGEEEDWSDFPSPPNSP